MSAHSKSGFTLVELLVVITIIAILSVIGITVFGGVQKGARDARRRGDIDAIAKAMEVHYRSGYCFPTSGHNYCPPRPEDFAGNQVPKDPKGGCYIYNGSSTVDTGGLLPGDGCIGGTSRSANTFTICADLETVRYPGASVDWDGTQQDYCRSNQQ